MLIPQQFLVFVEGQEGSILGTDGLSVVVWEIQDGIVLGNDYCTTVAERPRSNGVDLSAVSAGIHGWCQWGVPMRVEG